MTTIAPNDPNLLYSPYTWKIGATRATTTCGGAYVKASIQGSPADLTLLLDYNGLSATKGRIWHRTDDGPWIRTWIGAGTSINLTLNSSWPVHMVEIMLTVRGGDGDTWTAPPNGAFNFAGFSSTSTITSRKVWPRPMKGFALGDSLAQGILTTNTTDGNDARFAWAYPLTDALGAEIGVRGFGGVGLTKAGDGLVPKFGTIWNQLWDGEPADFSSAPDFIVTMPGTNDSAATDALVTSETVTLLNAMLAATPATTGIVVARNLKGTKASAIQAGIAACSTPSRVYWLDTTGWWVAADSSDNTHPFGYVNINEVTPRMAAGISGFLKSLAHPTATEYIWNGTAWAAL